MTMLSPDLAKLPKIRVGINKMQVKKMREAAMKRGVWAVFMSKSKKWHLLKVSHSTTYVGKSGDKGWEWPLQHVCHAQFAISERVFKAKRRAGAGKGKRPYPTVVSKQQMQFRSERLALMTYLLQGETFKWST